jgi:glycosyltransferase involved in cell wall biosynthesis
MKAIRWISRIPDYTRRYGWRTTVSRGRGELARIVAGPANPWGPLGRASKAGALTYFESILGTEQGSGEQSMLAGLPDDSITWVIPDFSPGSGGHTTILRIVYGLEQRGWRGQTIVVQRPARWSSADNALQAIRRHFFPLEHTRVVIGCENIPASRHLMATGWQTAYWVAKYRDALNRLYFVQDFEPNFYPMGTEHLLAEGTYRLGLRAITAGDWLKGKLTRDYGMQADAISFSCDHDIYRPGAPREAKQGSRIFFYARPATPRRAFELGALALKRICESRPGTRAHLAGWDLDGYQLSFPHLDAKILTPTELAESFRHSDVALVLSTTNLSLMPLEILACGCPLVINHGPNNDWLVDEATAWQCDLTVESIAETLGVVLDGGPEVEARRARGLALSQSTSWDREFEKFDAYLRAGR